MKKTREERILKRELRRERKEKSKEWKRSGKMVKHHILNRCHNGKSTPSNLLLFDRERENAWHFLFRNMSFREVAELLLRTCEMKGQED